MQSMHEHLADGDFTDAEALLANFKPDMEVPQWNEAVRQMQGALDSLTSVAARRGYALRTGFYMNMQLMEDSRCRPSDDAEESVAATTAGREGPRENTRGETTEYTVPLASEDNRLELAVTNSTEAPLEGGRVRYEEGPSWIRVKPASVDIGKSVSSGEDVLARFKFDVDKAAPVGESETLRFAFISESGAVTEVKEILLKASPPERVVLHGSYPNPARQKAVIGYELPQAARARVEIYDALGRKVAQIPEEHQEPGYRKLVWQAGAHASGLYLYRLIIQDESGEQWIKKGTMTLVR